MGELWNPLLLSLRIALAATVLGILTAVPLALFMSRRRFRGKSLVEALIVVPMVLPPTVVGYMIIILLGAHGWIGQWPYRAFGYSILFRFEGAVLAAAVVSMPMLYLPAKAAFAGIERDLEDSARIMGANRWQIFWYVSLPMARRGLFSGLLLAFARALGEFGATVMVFGMQSSRITLPISIWSDYEDGDFGHAIWAVIALSVISLIFIMAYNRSAVSTQE
jgi:molybdate transport system permease protein